MIISQLASSISRINGYRVTLVGSALVVIVGVGAYLILSQHHPQPRLAVVVQNERIASTAPTPNEQNDPGSHTPTPTRDVVAILAPSMTPLPRNLSTTSVLGQSTTLTPTPRSQSDETSAGMSPTPPPIVSTSPTTPLLPTILPLLATVKGERYVVRTTDASQCAFSKPCDVYRVRVTIMANQSLKLCHYAFSSKSSFTSTGMVYGAGPLPPVCSFTDWESNLRTPEAGGWIESLDGQRLDLAVPLDWHLVAG